MKKYLALLFVFLMVAPVSALGDTFFVAEDAAGDGSGSNYNNRASIATHNAGTGNFATLDGDTVYLCGTFETRLIIADSGSSGNVVFYDGDCSSQGGDDAYFDFAGNTSADVIDLDDIEADYITISGVTVRGGHNGVYCDGDCDYITVIKSTFYDQDKSGVFIDGSGSNLTVGGSLANRNYFYDSGWDNTGSMSIQAGGSGGTVSWNVCAIENYRFFDCVQAQTASNITVEYNISDGGREDGVDFKRCVNCVIRYNEFKNNKNGIQIQNDSDGVHCYGNKLSGNYNYGLQIKDSSYTYGGTEDVFAWANLIYDNEEGGIVTDNRDNEGMRRIHVYNNTVAENGEIDEDIYKAGFWCANAESNYVVKNNIFYNNDPNNSNRRQLVIDDITGITLDYNRYYHTGGAIKNRWGGTDYTFAAYQSPPASQDANGSEADPGFTDPDNNDYTLSALISGTDTADDTNTHADRAKVLDPVLTDIGDWVNTVSMINTAIYGWPLGAFGYIGCAPYQPTNGTPADEATGVDINPTLIGSTYTLPAGCSSSTYPITESHWQLTEDSDADEDCTDENWSDPDYESNCTTGECLGAIPQNSTFALGLKTSTKHCWRARYKNSVSYSPWSTATWFETGAPSAPGTGVIIGGVIGIDGMVEVGGQ